MLFLCTHSLLFLNLSRSIHPFVPQSTSRKFVVYAMYLYERRARTMMRTPLVSKQKTYTKITPILSEGQSAMYETVLASTSTPLRPRWRALERGPGGAAAAVFGATSEDPIEAPLFPSLGKTLTSPAMYASYVFRFATLPLLAPFAASSSSIAEVMYLSRFMLPDALRRSGWYCSPEGA